MLFAALVIAREQWVLTLRLRERTGRRLAPVIGHLLDGQDVEAAAEELRPVIDGLGSHARPVGAWLVLDALRDAETATRAVVCRVLDECGAIEVAERSSRRWMPWR